MRPAQDELAFRLSRRCLDNWPARLVSKVKAAGMSDIASPKSFAQFCGQALGQQDQQFFSVGSPCLALLLVLNNVPANLEVGAHLHQVNATRNGVAGGQDQRADAGIQRQFRIRCYGRCARHFFHG